MNQVVEPFGHEASLETAQLRPVAELLIFVFTEVAILPQIFLSTKYIREYMN